MLDVIQLLPATRQFFSFDYSRLIGEKGETFFKDAFDLCVQLLLLLIHSEVRHFCGERGRRDGKPCMRWGTRKTSFRLFGHKVPIEVPRMRDKVARKERKLQTLQALRKWKVDASQLTRALLFGISQRNYRYTLQVFADSCGLSAGTIRKTFIEEGQKVLEAFESRSLEDEDIVVLWLDGKCLAEYQMIVCMGCTIDGTKKVLGFCQVPTENAEAVKELLEDLRRRGLRINKGMLCVLDGSKGLRKAVNEVFGDCGHVQRCQWHKKQNVLSKIDDEQMQEDVGGKLEAAWGQKTYKEARERLEALTEELEPVHSAAASSLREGMEEMLTLHRLGVRGALRKSLRTNNAIESLNSLIAGFTRNVKRWTNTHQIHRWIALALVETERRLNPLRGAEDLLKLREAMCPDTYTDDPKSSSPTTP